MGDTPSQFAKAFPPVDLGYAIHKPTYINITASGLSVAKYNNIRFAQPPVGDLRFRKPKTPPPQTHGVQDGSQYPSTDCVSSAYAGVPFPGLNGTTWGQEDCLFVNVQVPDGIKEGDQVPVLHWIHGSGYAFGSKDTVGITVDPEGLFDNLRKSDEKFIFVTSNYRLGLYGWMSSPEEDMAANIGLHDSITAVQWTRDHISKFGGSPERITVIGQSAGAGIINLMLTSYGGSGKLPFSQVRFDIPDNYSLSTDSDVMENYVYNEVLKAAGCPDLACLRTASSDVLKAANHHLIVEVPTGTGGASFGPGIGFSPAVDGNIVPEEPMILLEQGRFHKEVQRVLAANTAFEGNGLSTDSNMPEAFPGYVRINFPTASNETIQRIQNLFPFPPDKPERLAWDWLTSIVYACHSTTITKAYGSKAYRYVMRIPPATHALDLTYFFFVDNQTTPVVSYDVARQSQEYLYQFLLGKGDKGDASLLPSPKYPAWPPYGTNFHTMDIVEHGFELKTDPWETNGICRTLIDIVKDPENGN
ncbi:uncharacterized protein GIQ15_04525 [Arthroderma uncinatum]|uniref:uncharacterized protein n=1 Tax=Arthroderma uncinatum TaxID=74035 RepID=UPI00144ACF2C|nr:uncharacterized protein GIQ15_04525 [Arthroderma uncinatum]KAF3481766.1 hypothetical protein GIQ15_04525 [Arthroderma uncinatum]